MPGTPGFFNATTGHAGDEDQLAAFVHHNGPVSAGINSDVFALRSPPGCGGAAPAAPCFVTRAACANVSSEIDHSIAVVGYGVDAANGPFWLIKNSWGAAWANSGFINVARGVQCAGLCSDPSICGNVFAAGDPGAYYE